MLQTYLKEIREIKNITQQEVAEALNVSAQSISKWENSLALPSVDFLPKLAKLYDCSISAFFCKSEFELYKKFANLTDEEGLEEILKIIYSKKKDALCPIPRQESLAAFLLKPLYLHLKSAETFSISKLQEDLMISYFQIINIVKSFLAIGIMRIENNKCIYLKDKLDLMLPFAKESIDNYSFEVGLKRLRTNFHITQKKISTYLNVSPQAVGKWEKGLSVPSVEILLKLISLYECSIDTFFSVYECIFYGYYHLTMRESFRFMENIFMAQAKAEEHDNPYFPDKKEIKLDYPPKSLFLPNVYDFLKNNSEISIPRLQQALHLGYAVASNIMDFLFLKDIISFVDKGCWKVNSDKIDQIFA